MRAEWLRTRTPISYLDPVLGFGSAFPVLAQPALASH